MLGDNAYESGTDGEYQNAVFNVYQAMLRKSVLLPTLGNHDTAQSTAFNDNYPISRSSRCRVTPKWVASPPAPSITTRSICEYPFHLPRLHDREPRHQRRDGQLAAERSRFNVANWIVAYWHHPSYTKGSHNSDTEIELVQMRQVFNPFLKTAALISFSPATATVTNAPISSMATTAHQPRSTTR
jgi:hypothetical protein